MNANSFVVNTWYVAGVSDEFKPGALQGQVIAGKPVVMWRSLENGKVVAFDDRCAHKKMPLSAGKLLANDEVECAYHGFCYNTKGTCTKIPTQPDLPIPTRAKLKPFAVLEQDGLVWIWPGDQEKIGKTRPPRAPEIADDKWETISSGPMAIPANYRLVIENLLDISHFYPLHDGNIGDVEHSVIPVEFTEPVIDGNATIKSTRNVQNYKHPPYLVDWFGYKVVDREHTHAMLGPGLTRVELRCAPPGELGTDKDRGYILYHSHTPVDKSNHVWRWFVNCRTEHRAAADPTKSLAQGVAATFPDVVAQDLWALEKQQIMVDYPDDGYEEVHLRSDRALLTARKILEDLERT